jgi:hypothetical protein
MKNYQNKANIARVSKIIRHLLFAGLIFEIIGIPVVLIASIPTFFTGRLSPSGRYLSIGTPLFIILCLVVTLKLFRFFDRLKSGRLFDAQTVKYLDAAGRWWVALWFFEVIFYTVGRKFFGMNNVGDFTGNLFAGLILIFVAWLLKEAQELEEEHALTV